MQQKKPNAPKAAIEDALTLIGALELPYLIELSKHLEEHIAKRRKEDIVEARRKIEMVAQRIGMTVDELFDGKAIKAKGKRPALYADPQNPMRTWSGHGPKPYWLRDLERQGHTLDSLRIADAQA